MSDRNLIQTMSTEAAKAAPPITVAAITLNEWVAIATLAYIALQSAFLLWKWRCQKADRAFRRGEP